RDHAGDRDMATTDLTCEVPPEVLGGDDLKPAVRGPAVSASVATRRAECDGRRGRHHDHSGHAVMSASADDHCPMRISACKNSHSTTSDSRNGPNGLSRSRYGEGSPVQS